MPNIIVEPTNFCCWGNPWWRHLGAETFRSWHVIWSVFYDFLCCNLFSNFCCFFTCCVVVILMKNDLKMAVSEMLLDLNHLTWLLARDDYFEFCCGESFKIYTMVSPLHKRIVVVLFYIHRLQKILCRFQGHLRKFLSRSEKIYYSY